MQPVGCYALNVTVGLHYDLFIGRGKDRVERRDLIMQCICSCSHDRELGDFIGRCREY